MGSGGEEHLVGEYVDMEWLAINEGRQLTLHDPHGRDLPRWSTPAAVIC